jgi:hypothetical protein
VLLGLLNPEEAYADFPDTHDACTQQQLEGGYNCKTLILDEDELGCYTMQQENGYKDGQYFTDSWWQECDRNGKPKGKKHDYDRFKYIAWTENMPTWSASDIDKYTRAMGHPPNPPSRMEWLRFFQPERYAEEIESQQQIQIRYGQPTRTAKPTLTPTGIPLPTNTPEPPTSTPEPTATSVPTQEVAIVELPSENKSEIAPGLGQATALPGPEWLTATPVPTNIPIAKVEEGDLVENDIEKQRVAVEEVEDRESEKSNDGDNLKLLGISTTAVGIAGIGIWKIRARIARRLNSFTSRQVSTLAIEDGKASLKYIDKAKIRLLLSTYGSRITEVPIGNNRKQRIYLIFTVEGNAGSETIKAWIIDFNTTLSHSRVVGQEINQLHGVPVVSKQVNGTASSSVIADFKRIAVSDLINRNIAYYLGRYRARIPEESNWI